ncbi:MAG: type II toxin-antitoxin system HicB family antitoxin [Clostridia bacterium]|nr:type II toxin-antitoxin system HicB family antitoxin [Clostridia bacterium]
MKNLIEYNGYHAKIEISEADGCFVGSVIGIKDSLNFHGSNLSELKEAFKSCIDNYIEICREFGKEPDKEYKGSLNIRINPSLHKKLDITASENGVTLNQQIATILNSYFEPTKTKETVIVMPMSFFEKRDWSFNSEADRYGFNKSISCNTYQEVAIH